MNRKLPSGVAQVIVHEGAVFVEASADVVERGISLSTGQDVVRFESASEFQPPATAAPAHEVPFQFKSNALVARVEPRSKFLDEIANCHLSYTPETGDVVEIEIIDPETNAVLHLASFLELPKSSGKLVFEAGLAAIGAEGRLVLDIETGGQQLRKEIAIPKGTAGSKDDPTLPKVTSDLPAKGQAVRINLSLVFDKPLKSKSKQAPQLLLSAPKVLQIEERSDSTQPIVFQNGAVLEETIWLKSLVPARLEPGQELQLLDGDEAFALFAANTATVELVNDFGHTLIMSASEEAVYCFEIDGEKAFDHKLGPTPGVVSIPRVYQDGAMHRVSVLDRTRSQVLLSEIVITPRILTPVEVLQVESSAPFPGPLMAQATHRYGSLKAQMRVEHTAEGYRQIHDCLAILEGGYHNVKLKPLVFPKRRKPDVSIVIPAHNKVEVTYFCLASLLLAHNEATFEVILVDDASTDETAKIEKIVSGVTVVRNKEAQRFIKACNAGVAKAKGKYVVLLNNDVEATSGWLDELIDGFARFDNVGLVGSKLLYPDGKLQDAGGLVWGSGNPWNYGNRQNPWDPRFCYARQVDYLSGAALMTTKEIWDQVDGLSNYLEPMYFEDTDLAFKVRDAGYTTWFIPSSIIYHYEGMTSGSDTSSGFKRYQEVNRPKFKERWAEAFKEFGEEAVAPDLEKDRGIKGRVLFIDNAVPRPDRDAGSYAAIQEIKLVQSLGYKVTYLPVNLAHLGGYTTELEKMGVEVVYAPFYLSIDSYVRAHATEFDAFFITRFYIARGVLDQLKDAAPGTKILFNNADLHFLRELRAGVLAGDEGMIAASRETREAELEVMKKADVVLSYSEIEHSVIQSHAEGQVEVAKCPWVVEMPDKVPGLRGRSGMSFLGSYQHAPNAEGVLWFAEHVMPLITEDHSDLLLTIYGSGMTDEIKALKSETIDPRGFVQNISDAYDDHRIFVAPLLSGAGIKGKVLAALAHGIPCVLTPIAAEGIGLRHKHDCLIAQKPEEWQEAVNSLQTDDVLWKRLSSNARAYVEQTFSFAAGRELMRRAFEKVDLGS